MWLPNKRDNQNLEAAHTTFFKRAAGLYNIGPPVEKIYKG
jgi:hypothetical protein